MALQPSFNIASVIRENTIDSFINPDKLTQKLLENFSTDDKQHFLINFYLYNKYDDTEDYVIDLDKVYEWIGFAAKHKAKELQVRYFQEGQDYKILLNQPGKQVHGGHNKETIMMNINTFKSMCLKANTKKAHEIHDYYLKMEKVIFSVTKEQLAESKRLLQEQENLIKEKEEIIKETEKAQKETLKENEKMRKELEKGKHSKELAGYIYIGCDLRDNRKDIYKVGETMESRKRLSSMCLLLCA
jgi:phage anti-repressor protein